MKTTINAHSSVRIVSGSTVYFDPFMISDHSHDADVIFITHSHFDHFSPEDIVKVMNDSTLFVAPKSMENDLSKAGFGGSSVMMEPGESAVVSGVNVTAIPAYNTNKPMHKKEFGWLGYVVEVEGQRIYVAGDTDATPEAEAVAADLAFLPIGGTYTMDAGEAAELADKMKVKKVIPYHYGAIVGNKTDGERFASLVKSKVEVQLIL